MKAEKLDPREARALRRELDIAAVPLVIDNKLRQVYAELPEELPKARLWLRPLKKAVGVFAALLLWSSAQYMELNDRVAVLRSDLSALQEENVQLSAQYEELFDMERIQAAVGDAMVRPAGDQVVYLDLSEPDSVVLYGEEAGGGVLAAYFR